MSRTVPFFNYPALFKADEPAIMGIVHDVLSRGAYIMQRDLVDFEKELARYLGVKHAIGLADGTLAIKFGLICAGVGEGDEVILPSHTFVATASAVHHVGATPVLCDSGPDHLMDAESVRKLITKKTKALLPVQLNGRTANMDPILKLAKEYDLKIMEDSCQALGSKFRGRFAGTFGVAGSYSFYPSKTLGAFGDAGAMVTDSDEHAEIARQLRDHGRGSDGLVHRWGLNARLDNLHAAVLLHKMKSYDQAVARRREIARLYDQRLRHLNQLLLPPAPDSDPNHFDIFQNYEIEAERRDALRAHLTEQGIGTIMQWGGKVIHQFPALGLRHDAPNAERMTQKFMMLPLNLAVSDDDVNYVCDKIEAFYRQ